MFGFTVYWNPKSREEPALGDLASHGASWAISTKNEKKPQRKYVGHVEKLDLRFLQNKTETFLVSVTHLILKYYRTKYVLTNKQI